MIGAIVVGSLSLLLPTQYTARTTFVPDASGTMTVPRSLMGIAGQFGLSSALSSPSTSPEFFAEVLTSHEVLEATLRSDFVSPDTGSGIDTQPLVEILGLDSATTRGSFDKAVRRFRQRLATAVDARSGIVTLDVETLSPQLAADVANRMIELLNAFNLAQRQSSSKQERRFVAERRDAAREELRASEADYQRFLERNRSFEESPILRFEADRLEREVQLKQEIFLTISREYEQARIAEVRDTPVITVIDSATPPERRSSPRPVLNAAMAGAVAWLAALLSIMVSMGWETLRSERPDIADEFRRTLPGKRHQRTAPER